MECENYNKPLIPFYLKDILADLSFSNFFQFLFGVLLIRELDAYAFYTKKEKHKTTWEKKNVFIHYKYMYTVTFSRWLTSKDLLFISLVSCITRVASIYIYTSLVHKASNHLIAYQRLWRLNPLLITILKTSCNYTRIHSTFQSRIFWDYYQQFYHLLNILYCISTVILVLGKARNYREWNQKGTGVVIDVIDRI